MSRNIFAEIAATNPDCEIWWDSSPLIYSNWTQNVIANAPPEKRAAWELQLRQLFDPENPVDTLVRGVTTNPPLSYNAIKDNPT